MKTPSTTILSFVVITATVVILHGLIIADLAHFMQIDFASLGSDKELWVYYEFYDVLLT